MKLVIRICLMLALSMGIAGAADLKLLNDADNGTFKAADGSTLLYAFAAPQSPKLGKRYPLVIFLHGAGGRKPVGERNPQRSWDGGGQFFETMTEDCYFLLPQAHDIWSGIPWDRLPYTMSAEPAKCQNQAVVECVESLLKDKKLAIDPERVYIAGTSMGSMGMWDLACRRPELFAAGISCCGGFDAAQAPKISKIKFRLFHGDADNIVPAEGSRLMHEALKSAGADVEYTIYPGEGHMIWDKTYRNKAVVDWLFQQRRTRAKAASADVAEFRTWETKKGEKAEAKLLQTILVLKRKNGSEIRVDLQTLSQKDIDYVKSLLD